MKLMSVTHVVILFMFEPPFQYALLCFPHFLKGQVKSRILQKASFSSNLWNLPFFSTLQATTLFYIIVDYSNCYLRHT